jgi:hypothetical protein
MFNAEQPRHRLAGTLREAFLMPDMQWCATVRRSMCGLACAGLMLVPGEWYFDASYLARDVLANFDLRLSVMNLLDNAQPIGMVVNNGVFHPRGRNAGVQLSKRF